MIRQSKWTVSILGALLTCLVGTTMARAEATKEIWSDAGFYTENTNFFLFDGVLTPPTLDFEGEPGIPEGVQTIGQFSPAGQYVGWGFANVTAPGSFTLQPQDFSDYLGGDIRFWIKSDSQIFVEIQYDGISPNPRVPVPSTNNQWEEVIIPLSSLGATQQRLSKVLFQFIVQDLPVPSNRLYFIDHIRWTKPVQDLVLTPTNTEINPGQTRQFTAEGRDSNDELVIVYPTWSTNRGSLDTTGAARSVVLSITTFSSDGQVTASADGENAVAQVDITNADISEKFGILSETIDGVELGSENPSRNSEFLLFSENNFNPNTLPEVEDVIAYSPEGTQHNKVILRRKTLSTQFQGMAISWGVGLGEADLSRDLNLYHNGSVRFWFKAPASATQLRDKLTLGVRSVNVDAGSESSSVLLKDYTNFDDTWNAVTIPISDLVGPPPFADISRVKVFFALSVAGTLTSTNESNRTFYIDNVRWDTELPGALSQVQIVPVSDPTSTPLGSVNEFKAIGLDSSGTEVDVFPSWSFVGSSLGQLIPDEGPRVILKAANNPVSGLLRATANGQNPTVSVTVTDVNFPESFNITSDLESSGVVIISTGSSIPAGQSNNTEIILVAQTENGAPGDENGYFEATMTLDNHSTDEDDAFAVLGVIHPAEGRYLENYSDGFIQFSVRSNIDLQISIGSFNVDPDFSQAKATLSELGIPTSNPGTGTWQEVIVPVSLFKDREPDLDFSILNTYFTIGAPSSLVGEVSGAVFDVDNVKWFSRNAVAANLDQIVAGLEDKQTDQGVLRSFNDSRAVTYDQALAAMAFTIKDVRDGSNNLKSKAILDAYLGQFVPGQGFFDEYDADFFSNLAPLVDDKLAGPNAFLLLAAIHYAETTGSTAYDAMIDGLANWLAGFQDTDGAIKFGQPLNPFERNLKSTEHNLDCYAAFLAYANYSGDASFNTKATDILTWLETDAWNTDESRFNVGELENGSDDTRKALDIYSWAPLALLSDSSLPVNLLPGLAEIEFGVSIPNVTTGRLVTGVDFGRSLTEPADNNDAVWLEGMGQMSVAYATIGNATKQQEFIDEINKAAFLVSANTQGLSYATNQGTAFGGGIMNAVDPSVSSMAWYVFANEGFNPFLRTTVVRLPNAGVDQTVEKLFKGSGFVDGSDFLLWQVAFGSVIGDDNYNPLMDAEPDGDVDGDDFLRWQAAAFTYYWEPAYDFGVDADEFGYAPVLLSGSLNPPGAANVEWTVVSSPPGSTIVRFEDANALETNALFTEVGVYTLRLTVNGGPSDDIVITIDPNPNQAPQAAAAIGGGQGQEEELHMNYKGSIGDGIVDAKDYRIWKVEFGKTGDIPADMNNNNVVDAADYVVWRDRLGANGGVADINTGEPIDFGFQGSASDDGNTDGFVVRWRVTVGHEASVDFDDSSDPTTTATFNEPGNFEVKLLATDGVFLAEDSLIVRVRNPLPSGSAAAVDSGDFLAVAAALPSQWGDSNFNSDADFNGDNQVDENDLGLLVGALGTTEDQPNWNPKYNIEPENGSDVDLVNNGEFSVEASEDQTTSLVSVSAANQVSIVNVAANVRINGQPINGHADILWYPIACTDGPCGPVSFARNRTDKNSLTFSKAGNYKIGVAAYNDDFLKTDSLKIVVDSNGRVIDTDPVSGGSGISAVTTSIVRVIRSRFVPANGESAEFEINLPSAQEVRTTIQQARTGKTVKYQYDFFGAGQNILRWNGAGAASGLYNLIVEAAGQIIRLKVSVAK